MPSTAARVTQFVYTDDPRVLVPPEAATIQNWRLGQLQPVYNAEAQLPPCELSQMNPIKQPIVCFSPQQTSMDHVQMYSSREWMPRLTIYEPGTTVYDPAKGYEIRSENDGGGLVVPPSWIIPCVPYYASPQRPLQLADPDHARCLDALVRWCLTTAAARLLHPIKLREAMNDSLCWAELRQMTLREWRRIKKTRVVLDDIYGLLGGPRSSELYGILLDTVFRGPGATIFDTAAVKCFEIEFADTGETVRVACGCDRGDMPPRYQYRMTMTPAAAT